MQKRAEGAVEVQIGVDQGGWSVCSSGAVLDAGVGERMQQECPRDNRGRTLVWRRTSVGNEWPIFPETQARSGQNARPRVTLGGVDIDMRVCPTPVQTRRAQRGA